MKATAAATADPVQFPNVEPSVSGTAQIGPIRVAEVLPGSSEIAGYLPARPTMA